MKLSGVVIVSVAGMRSLPECSWNEGKDEADHKSKSAIMLMRNTSRVSSRASCESPDLYPRFAALSISLQPKYRLIACALAAIAGACLRDERGHMLRWSEIRPAASKAERCTWGIVSSPPQVAGKPERGRGTRKRQTLGRDASQRVGTLMNRLKFDSLYSYFKSVYKDNRYDPNR